MDNEFTGREFAGDRRQAETISTWPHPMDSYDVNGLPLPSLLVGRLRTGPWRTIADPLHGQDEDRFVILGESHQRRMVVVVFAERGENIRIISARRASRRERKDYEEGIE